ncbi:hypothetical protein [Natrinema marinum]|uniref:hypothetical protein n=1 Tax=Natrinema marinum TaxID=2961598 RepID=UPI0020C85461|nr:hypothetical protein [Natrinema marinum]
MGSETAVDLVDYRRGGIALGLAFLTLLFNYGDAVVTPLDAVLWVSTSVVVGYPVLTVFSVVGARIWEP